MTKIIRSELNGGILQSLTFKYLTRKEQDICEPKYQKWYIIFQYLLMEKSRSYDDKFTFLNN